MNKASSGKFELLVELEVPLGDVCWCLISAGDWLFCGLGDGSIKAAGCHIKKIMSHEDGPNQSQQHLRPCAGLHEIWHGDDTQGPHEASGLPHHASARAPLWGV